MEGGHGPTPPLWRFSDVLWLQWEAAAAAAEQSVSNIKYFLRNGVKDWDSLAVVDAIRQRGYPLKGWANCDTFEMQDDDPDKQDIARALLGTPNGNGIVWFLLQHKQQTGKRFTVSRVTLWEGALDATMLLFDVEEVSS
ncbi:Mitochondrial import inner membrane translocase subunit tim8 [Elasticomyces elasticus]|nr:Mitochondrial import inner membrane translocase subunit tim8 [Elasticomyces elasticus]